VSGINKLLELKRFVIFLRNSFGIQRSINLYSRYE